LNRQDAKDAKNGSNNNGGWLLLLQKQQFGCCYPWRSWRLGGSTALAVSSLLSQPPIILGGS
jgi:hypothetical protein